STSAPPKRTKAVALPALWIRTWNDPLGGPARATEDEAAPTARVTVAPARGEKDFMGVAWKKARAARGERPAGERFAGAVALVVRQPAGELRPDRPVAVEHVQPARELVVVDVVLAHDPHRDPVEHLAGGEVDAAGHHHVGRREGER